MEILYVRQKLFREKRRVRIRSRGTDGVVKQVLSGFWYTDYYRNRAMSISPAYAVFLTAAAVCAVLICVLYLNLQSEVVSRSENVTAMQEQLADLTEANNTAYNSAADSVNLETVRDRAMNEMGMVYAAQGTIVEYDSPEGDYVKQYNDIPESGVLAKSSDVLK